MRPKRLDRLIYPPLDSSYEEARQRIRLLRALQVTVIMTASAIIVFVLALDSQDYREPEVIATVIAIAVTGGLYLLGRLGHTSLSAAGLVLMLSGVVVTVPYLPSGGASFLAYGVVPVMITGMFFDMRWMLLVSATVIGLTYFLNWMLLSDLDLPDYRAIWYFQIVSCTAAMSLVRHIIIVEQVRYRELETANQRLRESESLLEKRVEERTAELRLAYEQIQTLNHAKDEFVANVSHELRTPISSLKLQHYLLQASATPAQQTPLDRAVRETARLSTLIELLLSLSRLDQGRVEFHFLPLDLNALVHEYAMDRAALAERHRLTVQEDLASHPVTVLADQALIGQALSVLLTNAFNYTPPGGQVTLSTAVLTDVGGRAWGALAVSDTGPGIAPDEQPRLFQRFFRGSAARQSEVPGTGLGLAIARAIVDQHQGRIEVESKGIPGDGARFRVLLPCAP